MAINIKFDLVGNPEPPTILLGTRNGNILGQLDVNQESIDISDKFNDASEFSFTLNKYYFDEEEEIEKITNLWYKVVNFKLIYCQEWDMWFEITVELDEETETVKTVFCTQLGQAELSNLKLYNIHINEEGDINWNTNNETYKSTILYDENDKSISLLDRLLKDKAPHYSILHVDNTIKKIQRTFSFDGISIYDAFMEIAEEIGCLFVFHSNSDKNGKIQRTISVYDLQQNCLNPNCGHRGEFTDVCPECGGKNENDEVVYGIKYGYGEDTLIFITSDELASNGIQLTTNTDEVKNCFKLEAGDDLMTATVRNCNPNGTDYIWRFSEDMKSDMSKELVNKIEKYNQLYRYYYTDTDVIPDGLDSSDIKVEKPFVLNNQLVDKYNNELVEKYKEYYNEDDKKLEVVPTSIMSYSFLMNVYYNVIDLSLYLESGLMPTVKMGKTNVEEQGLLLEVSLPSLIAVTSLKTVSLETANSTVLAMAKAVVNSHYKVEIKSSELIDGNWSGDFIITNYSDEKDTYTTGIVSRSLTDWDEEFIRQKIEKVLSKENTDDLSITGLFEKEYDDFCIELKKYALNPLTSFHKACQACIDILIEQGVGNDDTWSDTEEGSEGNLYENLYVPYYNKLSAIESEMKIREDEINIILGSYDTNDNFIKGLQTYIEDCRSEIQNVLDFQNYLGEELWLEFCAYRREDTYSNNNYISDGLNNADLFKKASEFFKVAENEIFKASEFQHQISTTLNNLLAIPKFKIFVDSFKVGNWIRVQVDDKIYKLRLLEYEIDFGDFDNISVEFSDVTKIKNGITDVESTLKQASSMATTYSSVKRQASQGEKSNSIISNWTENGLNVTNTEIVGGHDDSLLFDESGFWCRQINPDTGEISDEQIKIFGSTIAITDDNWNTTKTAIGKYYYIDPVTGEKKIAYGVNGETIIGKFILGENLSMQNESGGMTLDGNGLTIISGSGDDTGTMTFNENGLVVSHGENAVTISPKSEEVINIAHGEEKVFNINENGELSINGNIIARSLKLENGVTIDSGVITNLATVATSGSYEDLLDTPTKLSDFENDGVFITKDANNLTNYYKKTEIDNSLNEYMKYPSLSSKKRQDILDLAGEYLDNCANFIYNAASNRNTWVDDTAFNDSGLIKMNCNMFAQAIWGGIAPSTFIGMQDSYDGTIQKAFDWGYYFKFPWRKFYNVKNSVGELYGYVQPNDDNYQNAYSITTYYSTNASESEKYQMPLTFMTAADMARELKFMGCEVPLSCVQTGDLVFFKAPRTDDNNSDDFEKAAFMNINHVAIVTNVTNILDCDITFIDCSSYWTNTINTSKLSHSTMKNAVQSLNLSNRIVMVARHPSAFGYTNDVPSTFSKI